MVREGVVGHPFLAMNETPQPDGPLLHLLHGEPNALAAAVIEAQKASGMDVDVVRCDLVSDWGAVVDKVLAAKSVCSW